MLTRVDVTESMFGKSRTKENIIREFHLNQVFTKINGGGDKEDKKSK